MQDRDIVYILKADINAQELKYSLRSIETNFPHRFVWFIGGQPEGLTPDRRIRHKQTGSDKWGLIRSSMLKVLQHEELSPEFYLFNDDFFVMRPFTGDFINYADRTLTERVEELRQTSHKWLTPYARTLKKAAEELKIMGCPEINYDVHLPMLFEKDKAMKAIMSCSSPQMRSVYGNYTRTPYIMRDDVKVYDLVTVPEDADFISTNDDTFNKGAVGEYIRGCFPHPSRFEKGDADV